MARARDFNDEATGDLNGRYRIARFLARGGMAEVFAGVLMGAEGFEKPVAIKRMLPKLSNDTRFARMFISEAKLAKFLHHQNIVEVIDVGLSGSGLFLVMELVNGWDLQIIIEQAKKKGRTFPPTVAAYITAQVLAGLCHAYRRKVKGNPLLSAHRDISTSNVLVSVEGEVKVADFGVARLAGLAPVTEAGTFKGKLAYAAPELFTGTPANHLSDQFALGNVLYQMLSTELPFGRPTNDVADFVKRLKKDTPPPLVGIPPELSEIVDKMLSKSPNQRFDPPEALARALAEFLSWSGIPTGAQELGDFLADLELPPPMSSMMEPQLSTLTGAIPVEISHEATRDLPPNEVFSLHSWPPENDAMAFPASRSMDAAGQIHVPEPQVPVSSFTCMACGKPLRSAFSACDNCTGELELDMGKMRRKTSDGLQAYIRKTSALMFRSAEKPKNARPFQMRWALTAMCVVLFLVWGALLIWPLLREAIGP